MSATVVEKLKIVRTEDAKKQQRRKKQGAMSAEGESVSTTVRVEVTENMTTENKENREALLLHKRVGIPAVHPFVQIICGLLRICSHQQCFQSIFVIDLEFNLRSIV